MTYFITLAGRKQVGKDTSAGLISRIIYDHQEDRSFLEEWNDDRPKVHIVHFADALKDACAAIFGVDRRDMETEDGKKKVTEVRWPQAQVYVATDERFRQPDGTMPMRQIWFPSDTNAFMTVRELLQFVGTDMFRLQIDPDIWVKSIFRRKYGPNDLVVVADCRFPNEADFAKQNGLLIKIERENGLVGDMHISERALDDYNNFDHVINNNTDLVALRQRLTEILHQAGFIL